MKEHDVPIQSLIDHIKTAIDVDPWAKDIVERLLIEHEMLIECIKGKCGVCPHCKNCDVDENGLLKEQEAVKPKCKERMGGFVAGLCPTCGTALNNVLNVKACGKCGQAVKWE